MHRKRFGSVHVYETTVLHRSHLRAKVFNGNNLAHGCVMSSRGDKSGIGIFYKILAAMLVVSLGPLAVYWYVGRVESIDNWTANGENNLRRASDAIASRVNGWLDTNLLVLRYTANLPDIRSMDPGRQNPILEQLNSGYNWSYLALTTDAAGKNIGRSDGKEQTDYSDRIYYRQIIQEGQGLGHQTLIGRTSGKPALVLAVPILDSGSKTGVLALASTLADITDAVAGSSVGDTGFAFLLDASGKAVAHPKEELSNALKDLTDHPAHEALERSGQDEVVTRYRDGDRDAIAVARKIGLDWVLVVQQDESEVFRAVRDADRYALYLVSGTVVVVVLLSLAVARRLTRPIVQLTAAADQLSRGILDVEVTAKDRRDEIGALARAVDRMGMSIKIATQRLRSKPAG